MLILAPAQVPRKILWTAPLPIELPAARPALTLHVLSLNLAALTVPDEILDAFKFVKFAPLIAAIVPVKFAAGIAVNPEAEPLNDVAVTIPVAETPAPA